MRHLRTLLLTVLVAATIVVAGMLASLAYTTLARLLMVLGLGEFVAHLSMALAAFALLVVAIVRETRDW